MFSAINFDLFKKYLCHESCSETGSVFEVAAGWAAKIQTESAAGAVFAKSKGAGLKKGILAHLQKSIAGKKTSGA